MTISVQNAQATAARPRPVRHNELLPDGKTLVCECGIARDGDHHKGWTYADWTSAEGIRWADARSPGPSLLPAGLALLLLAAVLALVFTRRRSRASGPART